MPKKGISRSFSGNLSHSTEELQRESFCASENFWYRKILWIRGREEEDSVTIFNQSFLSHSAEKFRRRTLLCCVSENFKIFGGNKIYCFEAVGLSRCSFESFCSYNAEKFRRRTLLCCVSVNFRWQKSLWIRGGWVSRFYFKNFLSHGSEKFRSRTL